MSDVVIQYYYMACFAWKPNDETPFIFGDMTVIVNNIHIRQPGGLEEIRKAIKTTLAMKAGKLPTQIANPTFVSPPELLYVKYMKDGKPYEPPIET